MAQFGKRVIHLEIYHGILYNYGVSIILKDIVPLIVEFGEIRECR